MEADKSVRTVLGRTVRRPSVVVLAAFALLVGGSELAAHGDRDSPEAAGPSGATATPEPHSATGTPTPAATGVAVAPPTPGADLVFDAVSDPFAAVDYPPRAGDRGEGYPQAFEMADWVWDEVGPGWALTLLKTEQSSALPPSEVRPTVVYLVSPWGAYFELTEVPAAFADGATLVSWQEQERTARFTREGDWYGATIDLTTGEVTDLAATLAPEATDVESTLFLAADAAGNEAWFVTHSGSSAVEYYEWKPGVGWGRILADQGDLGFNVGQNPGSPDGSFFVLLVPPVSEPDDYQGYVTGGHVSKRSLPYGQPNFVIFTLATGTSKHYAAPASLLASGESCPNPAWEGLTSITFACYDGGSGFLRFSVDGTGRVERASNFQGVGEAHTTNDFYFMVESRGADPVTYPGTPLEFAGPDGAFTSIRLVGADGGVVVDASKAPLYANGITVTEPSPNLYRVEDSFSYDEPAIVVTIDATTGKVVLGPRLGSFVYFGAATPYRQGWPAVQ